MTIKNICIFLFFAGITFSILGCNKDDDASLILSYFSHDLKKTMHQIDYFVPLDISDNFSQTFRRFDQNAEYDKKILKTLSVKYIRSAIHQSPSIYFRSEFISIHVQFPNRRIYEKYLAGFENNPSVSKKQLEKMLRYEYSAHLAVPDKFIKTKNFLNITNPVYKERPYKFFNKNDRDYYLTSDFKKDMDAISVWVRGKKWNDPNSAMTRKDGRLFINTVDSMNEQ